MSYGHMLKTVGRQEDGIAAYRRAIGSARARRSLVEPRQSEDRQVRRSRYRRDGSGACRARARATTTAFTSISRSARRWTIWARRRGVRAIMPQATRCGARSSPIDADDLPGAWSTAASSCSRAKLRRAAGRLRSARSDLHPRHAARGLDPGRADPVLAQPGRRHDRACRTCPLLARGRGKYPSFGIRAGRRASVGGSARNILSAPASSGGPSGRSSSTSCRTTGCSCRSSS